MEQLDERTMAYVMHDVDVLEALYKMEEKKRMDMNMKKEVDEKVNVVFAPFLGELAAVIADSLDDDDSPENLNKLVGLWTSANQVKDDVAIRLYAKMKLIDTLTHKINAGGKEIRELEKKLKKISDLVL